MTTDNDSAPPPMDQSAPPAAVDTPAPADATAAAAQRMQDDPDLIELSAAQAALKVEESATPADGQPENVEGAAPQAANTDKGQPQAVPMIPKPRFDEVNARATKAEQTIAYLHGQLEVLKGSAPAPQPGQQPNAPSLATPEAKLAAIHATQDDLAARFDAGEITYADMKKQERALADHEATIREEALLSKVGPAKGNNGGEELYLDTLTAQLETKHPWVMTFDAVGSDADWAYLKQSAMDNLAAKGIDPTKGAVGKYELRREMAELADALGPALVARKAQAKGIALPVLRGQKQQQQQPTGPSAAAQARAAKLGVQAGAPPNLSAMRGTGDDPATPSNSRIETMTDEEIAALPTSAKNKILGITA